MVKKYDNKITFSSRNQHLRLNRRQPRYRRALHPPRVSSGNVEVSPNVAWFPHCSGVLFVCTCFIIMQSL